MSSGSLVRLGHGPNAGGESVGQAGVAQSTDPDPQVLSEDHTSWALLLLGYGTQPLLGRPGSAGGPGMPHPKYETV